MAARWSSENVVVEFRDAQVWVLGLFEGVLVKRPLEASQAAASAALLPRSEGTGTAQPPVVLFILVRVQPARLFPLFLLFSKYQLQAPGLGTRRNSRHHNRAIAHFHFPSRLQAACLSSRGALFPISVPSHKHPFCPIIGSPNRIHRLFPHGFLRFFPRDHYSAAGSAGKAGSGFK